ncbi:MAG: DUF1559 domain-containing protein [Planctomycetaceae bacterium]|nr:DUF1559 domain-containing protein [Planctomycetaceae bacterium]
MISVILGVVEVQRVMGLKQTRNDLKWMGLALHQYHESYDCFPPPVVFDAAGKPFHSWRSIIHPQLSSVGGDSQVFAMYRFEERWNSPHNVAAANANHFSTNGYSFLAIVGPEAAWQKDGCRRMRDFKDGTWNTILAVGIKNIDVGWHEPCDLTFDGEKLWLERDGRKQPVDLSESEGFALFADGSVRRLGEGVPESTLKAFITRAGGEEVNGY